MVGSTSEITDAVPSLDLKILPADFLGFYATSSSSLALLPRLDNRSVFMLEFMADSASFHLYKTHPSTQALEKCEWTFKTADAERIAVDSVKNTRASLESQLKSDSNASDIMKSKLAILDAYQSDPSIVPNPEIVKEIHALYARFKTLSNAPFKSIIKVSVYCAFISKLG